MQEPPQDPSTDTPVAESQQPSGEIQQPQSPVEARAALVAATPAPRTRLQPWQGLVAALVGGVAAIIASLAFSVVAMVPLYLYQHPTPNIETMEQDILGLTMTLWVVIPSIAGSHGTLSLVPFLTAKLAKVPIRSALGLNAAPWLAFVAAPLGILGLGPTSDGIVHLMRWLAPTWTFGTLGQLDTLMQDHSFFVLWPVIALVPGFAEEIFFRGLVQRCLGNGALAIVVSGVSFACFHMDPHHVAGVLPVGLYLAWVAARTDSTWTTIVAHTVNNTMALVGSKFLSEAVGEDDPNPWIILGGLTITALSMAAVFWSTRNSTAISNRSAL